MGQGGRRGPLAAHNDALRWDMVALKLLVWGEIREKVQYCMYMHCTGTGELRDNDKAENAVQDRTFFYFFFLLTSFISKKTMGLP